MPTFIANILEINFGISFLVLKYYPYCFLLLPAIYFLSKFVINKNIRLPYVIIFFLTLFLFLFLESKYFRGNIIIDLNYPYNLFIIYTCFIVLINFGIKPDKRVTIIKYSIIIISFMAVIIYMGYAGLINLGFNFEEVDINTITDSRLIGKAMHPNGLSVIFSIGVCLLMICRKERKFKMHEGIRFFILIVIFMSVIILNASRGVFIITMLSIIAYIYKSWKSLSLNQKIIIIMPLIFLMVIGFFADIFHVLIKNIYLFNRLAEHTSFEEARGKQILLSCTNFIHNPWFGVGFHNATSGAFGLHRSNFSYTQVLAANGIFYFLLYIHFLYKMFGFNIKKITFILLSIAGYMFLMFYNLSLLTPLSLIAYLHYYEKTDYKLQRRFNPSFRKNTQKWRSGSIIYGTAKYFIKKINALQAAFAQFFNVVPYG